MFKTKLVILLVLLGALGLALAAFALRAKQPPPLPLKIIGVTPSLDPNYLYAPGLQIALTFNRPVNTKDFYYQLTPPIEFPLKSTSGGRQIIFSPEGGWLEGSYSLQVFRTTTAATGEKLDQDYSYQFQVGISEGMGP